LVGKTLLNFDRSTICSTYKVNVKVGLHSMFFSNQTRVISISCDVTDLCKTTDLQSVQLNNARPRWLARHAVIPARLQWSDSYSFVFVDFQVLRKNMSDGHVEAKFLLYLANVEM